MKTLRSGLGMMTMGLLALASATLAQEPPDPPRDAASVASPADVDKPNREGFIWGFAIGSGLSSTYRPAFDVHLGGMARPDLAVLLEFYGVDKPGNAATHGIIALGLQYWPAKRVWLRGGVGYGSASADEDSDASQEKLGGIAGVGFEVVRSGRFTLDLQVQGVATSGSGGASASFNVGLNWY